MFKKRISFLTLACALFLTIAWIQFSTVAAATATPPSDFVAEYPLPNAGTPRQMINHNGELWFTDPGANAIGRFVYTSTVDYAFDFYAIPTPYSEPYDLVIDGNILWFTELASNKIGKLNMDTGFIEDFLIDTANSAPTGITVTPNGNVWFVERDGNNLGKFDPLTESFTEYPFTLNAALLEDVDSSLGGDVIWFTAPGVQRIGYFTLATEKFDNVPVANPNTPLNTPSQLLVSAQGDPWVSTEEGMIGVYFAATTQFFRFYQVASENSSLDGMFLRNQGSDLQILFTGSADGSAGQLLTDSNGKTINKWVFPIGFPDGELYGIATMDGDTIWLADYANSRLLRWSSPYFLSVYLPTIINQG